MKYTIGEMSNKLNVHPNTLRNWEREGKIKPERTPGGERRYTEEMYQKLSGKNETKKARKTVAYCRVSSAGQREDLNRQVAVLESYCASQGYQFEIYQDIGSGMNYNRKKFNKLLEEIIQDEVEKVVLNYKDRLVRFGFEMLEQICKIKDVEIEIINQSETISYEKELVEDMISILTVYSSKLYGSRSHKNKKIVELLKE